MKNLTSAEFKQSQLELRAIQRDGLMVNPKLVWLFFEITNRCNLNCKHCGSSCTSYGEMLSIKDVEKVLLSARELMPMICITGGEPLMHPDFFSIAELIHKSGLGWGMTTNGTLIDDEVALSLKRVGMSTVSVSLDGMEKSHDLLRNKNGAWREAVTGLKALINAGFKPQVTTVLHRNNFDDLEPMFLFLCELGIESWRPINVEPIGRACESNDMMLSSEQLAQLLAFIRQKRFDRNCNMDVTFGCSHYLGAEYERMVRDHYFMCGAGILIASIRSNGDICACLDIANRPDLVQGNINTDDFLDVWQKGFKAFRRDRTADCSKCIECSERFLCGGDSAHTWDYESNKPLLCYKDFGVVLNNQNSVF